MADVGVAAPSFVSQAPKLGFVGGFDGVRGIGIMLVLAQHAYPLLFPSVAGIIDVFFVMSAFLIVSLLLQEHRSLHDINMRRFYARRALRLLPSAYLCLLAWVVVSLLFDRDRLVWVLQDAAAAVTYVYNLVFPVGIEAVDPQAASQRSIDQFWSLAVEEQFYLMVAVTVLVCIRKRWITQLAVVMVAIATYIGLARLFGQTGPWPGGPTNSSVPARGLSLRWLSRPDSLMWGVALAVLNARLPDPLPEKWRVWLPRAGAVGLVVAGTTMLLGSPFLHDLASRANVPHLFFPMAPHDGVDDGALYWIKFGHTLTALACMPALLAMVRTKDWWGNRGLSWKPLRFLGRMSYTLYVWHTLVYFLVLHVLGGNDVLGQKWRVPILMVVAVVACLPVFFWVEQPLMRAKLRFASEKEVVDLNTGKVIHVDDLRAASVDGARGGRR